jgi:ABC-type phosphate transport system substrate-binding protein
MAIAKKLALFVLLAAAPALAGAAEFKVVAHPSVSLERMSGDRLSRIFLKKDTRWPDGLPAAVIGVKTPEVREAFTEKVLGMSLGELRSYWAQLVFSGRETPPLERHSDAEVLEYVRSHPGAVGFVSGGAPTSGVKTLSMD